MPDTIEDSKNEQEPVELVSWVVREVYPDRLALSKVSYQDNRSRPLFITVNVPAHLAEELKSLKIGTEVSASVAPAQPGERCAMTLVHLTIL